MRVAVRPGMQLSTNCNPGLNTRTPGVDDVVQL